MASSGPNSASSSSSESAGDRSPEGSVLVTPELSNRPPVRSFTGYEMAPEHPFVDISKALPAPTTEEVLHEQGIDDWDTLDDIPALKITLDDVESREYDTPNSQSFMMEVDDISCHESNKEKTKTPFHKWMKSLHRRAVNRRHTITTDGRSSMSSVLSVDDLRPKSRRHTMHRHSSSSSSYGFVATVKTATASLASASILARSRRNSMRSSRTQAQTDRSSRGSMSGVRFSEDSTCLDQPMVVDKATIERSLQRRRILEELITTEEGYIGDVRFLMNVYITILVSLPTLPAGLRSSINRNLADIIGLHEELLGDLHRVVPHSEYTQLDISAATKSHGFNHRRIRSLDSVPEDKDGITFLESVPGMVAEPHVAAEVAQVFNKKMNCFFVYEEYGAKYEMMIKDIAAAHRTLPQWDMYQKGLETLASSLGCSSKHGDQKKSLTIGDLLVKPIQRVCKYPLLFAELLKYTPVIDSPHAHMEIENTLVRLREATSQINRATDDVRVKAILEKTWLLQDRLVFPESRLDAASKNRIRSFGHIQLCGVLHFCWQTKEGVDGQYLVTLLYKDWLCLASASRVDQIYTLQACIPRNDIKIEAVDNGRGLQCHTAPFSWKAVFECDCQLYEIIMTACTPREEDEWRSRLEDMPVWGSQEQVESALFSSLFLNLKTLGTVFGKQGTMARRISIHRATTVGPKSPLCQVILRNTSVEKDTTSSSSNPSINRSLSLLTTNGRVPVLAPSRGNRARLEAMLSDVWSREALPFPGMTARARSEHLVRTSAHSMIRKLSVTSIASTFTKRSASLASISRIDGAGDFIDEAISNSLDGGSASPSAPGVVTKDEGCPSIGVHIDSDDCFSKKSRLSIIDDESDKATPSTYRSRCDGSFVDGGSPRKRMRLIKSTSAWRLGELAKPGGRSLARSPSRALRATSVNSPRLGRHASRLSSKTSLCSLEQENGIPRRSISRQDSMASLSPQKQGRGNVSRWSKVEGLRRGVMAQGIRGFFR